MTYRAYLQTYDGETPAETKTITPDMSVASDAFTALVKRRDFDGQPLAAVLTFDNRQLAFHRFDRGPGDADYWRDKLHQIEWPTKDRPNYNEHRAGKRSFQANLKPEENSLVAAVKAQRGVTTDRELLLLLCGEEKSRHQVAGSAGV